MKWIRDEKFLRGKVPMTKFQTRALIMAYLGIESGDRFLDIGCGTGSISVEAALQGAIVSGIDSNPEAVLLTKKNAENFSVDIEVIEGFAPDDLPKRAINKCFIGGNRGKMEEIFSYLGDNLEPGGILAGSFIVLKNLNMFKELLKKYNYVDIETTLLQVSVEDKIGLMRGENPIFIVKGVKND